MLKGFPTRNGQRDTTEHIDLLQEISSSEETRGDVKSEATGLSKRKRTRVLNFASTMEHNPRKDEQNEGLTLNNTAHLLKSLWGFVDSQRDRFDEFEKLGIELLGTSIYRNDQLRLRRRKKIFCEEMDISDTDDTECFSREDFRVSAFLPIVDKLNS